MEARVTVSGPGEVMVQDSRFIPNMGDLDVREGRADKKSVRNL
jgi:hypothetical protein